MLLRRYSMLDVYATLLITRFRFARCRCCHDIYLLRCRYASFSLPRYFRQRQLLSPLMMLMPLILMRHYALFDAMLRLVYYATFISIADLRHALTLADFHAAAAAFASAIDYYAIRC